MGIMRFGFASHNVYVVQRWRRGGVRFAHSDPGTTLLVLGYVRCAHSERCGQSVSVVRICGKTSGNNAVRLRLTLMKCINHDNIKFVVILIIHNRKKVNF